MSTTSRGAVATIAYFALTGYALASLGALALAVSTDTAPLPRDSCLMALPVGFLAEKVRRARGARVWRWLLLSAGYLAYLTIVPCGLLAFAPHYGSSAQPPGGAAVAIGATLFTAVLTAMLAWVSWRAQSAEIGKRARSLAETIEVDRAARRQRLRNPNWEDCERRLGRTPPRALHALFGDPEMVESEDLAYSSDVQIAMFAPLDLRAGTEARELLGFDAVPVAVSNEGDLLYLRPGPNEADCIYLTHHDGGDTEIVAGSIDAFLDRLRRARGNHDAA